MIRLLPLLLTCALFAQEPAADAPPAAPKVLAQLKWHWPTPADYERLFEQAKKAEVNELDLLIPRVDAYFLFGDIPKLKVAYKEAAAARAQILRRQANGNSESVTHTLKLAKKLIEFAKTRPAEVGHRTTIFRSVMFSMMVVEDFQTLNAYVEEISTEKNLKKGDKITWEEMRTHLEPGSRLAETGATIFGDKVGPFVVGEVVRIPRATWEKLKEYVPCEDFGPYLPEGEEAPKPPGD